MLICHDDALRPTHVIYEHPRDYHEVLTAKGHRWLKAARPIALHRLTLAADASGAVIPHSDGVAVDVVARGPERA